MHRSCADVNSPYKKKCWTNLRGPFINSLLWSLNRRLPKEIRTMRNLNRGGTTWTGDFKWEVKTGFCRKRYMQTGSSETLIGWKCGKTTYVPLWDRFFWDSQWLKIWKNHLCPSMGPNGAGVVMDKHKVLCVDKDRRDRGYGLRMEGA